MPTSRTHLRLLAWMLYASILLTAFACSLGHGQMAGLQLAGAGSAFCLAGTDGPSGTGDSSDGAPLSGFSCPLCSSISLSLGLLLGLAWLLRPTRQRFTLPPPEGRTPPRYTWPSANPRASPVLVA